MSASSLAHWITHNGAHRLALAISMGRRENPTNLEGTPRFNREGAAK
jgi:hypothetical protein